MKKTHLTIAAAIGLFVLLAAFTLRPVPTVTEKECLVIKGTVTNIYEGGVKDVVFVLKGQKETYYINRGIEQGLDLNALKKQLEGKEITIKYPDHWSLLNPNGRLRHIGKVEFEGKTIYNETY
jgi:hypothetical protein